MAVKNNVGAMNRFIADVSAIAAAGGTETHDWTLGDADETGHIEILVTGKTACATT